jgi:hypothetical protein
VAKRWSKSPARYVVTNKLWIDWLIEIVTCPYLWCSEDLEPYHQQPSTSICAGRFNHNSGMQLTHWQVLQGNRGLHLSATHQEKIPGMVEWIRRHLILLF